jgi:hypothetical protein
MILRSVTKHVKNQNWFAVVLDLFIVVFGVFIGIQVSNWNETRLEEEKTNTYIERIRAELAENIEDFTQRKAYFQQVRKHSLAALKSINNSTEDLGEQFIIDVYQASQVLYREMGRDTYDEIISIGALNLDTHISMRKQLANFYRSIIAQLRFLDTPVPYRDLIRRSMPYETQKAIRKACNDIIVTGKNGAAIISLPKSCHLGLKPENISAAVLAIKNRAVQEELTKRTSQLDITISLIQLILDRLELMDSYLKQVK